MIYSLGSHRVELRGEGHFVAHNATVIGRVVLGAYASLWFNTVVRGDNDAITIGERTNVQDGAVLHTDEGYPLTIGAEVSIGHLAMLHGCTIGDGSLIGLSAVILNGAVIESDAMLAAGAMLTSGKTIRSGELWGGRPAKFMRNLTPEEIAGNQHGVRNYVANARRHATSVKNR